MADRVQRSFTAGELAPSLRSRVDLDKYSVGLALCENFIIRAQGGVYSRAGTRFVGTLADSTKRGRLLPFSFNTEQTYVLVFENLSMRVVRDAGYIESAPTVPYQLATTYTETQLPRLYPTQDADVMTLCHPSHNVANLNRMAETNWTLADVDYSPTVTPPAWASSVATNISGIVQANPAVVTVASTSGMHNGNIATISGVVGMVEINGLYSPITVIDGTHIALDNINSVGFTAYSSGGIATVPNITTEGSGAGTYDKKYTYVVTAVDADGVESLASNTVSITTKSLTATAGVRLTWNAVAGAEYYRVYKDPSKDTLLFGWIGESKSTNFVDFNIAPISGDSPPENRQPFAAVDDKPSTVSYYDQRQIFANTNNEPQAWFATQTANYKSMRTSKPSRADDAITQRIAARQVNEIRHIISIGSLLFLTSGGEWKVTEGQDQVLTPSTSGAKPQSFNGAAWVQPVVINSTAIYVQEKGGRIRDLDYEFASDKYTGNDLSLLSEHLFDGRTVVEMAYAAEPYGILWCAMDDGALLSMTYQREHKVWGWTKHDLGGSVESVAVISEGNRDALYLIVRRTLNGQTVRCVERMEARDVSSSANVWCVDCGLRYSGAPATVIGGLGHLEGATVVAIADGNVIDGLIVQSGSITLATAASLVTVGLPYTPVLETLDIDDPGVLSIKGKEVSVSKVTIEIENSRGGWVGPKADDGTSVMTEIKPRDETDSYDAITLRTGKESVVIYPEWNKGGGIRIEQRSAMPLAILSIIPTVDVGG